MHITTTNIGVRKITHQFGKVHFAVLVLLLAELAKGQTSDNIRIESHACSRIAFFECIAQQHEKNSEDLSGRSWLAMECKAHAQNRLP